MVAAHDVAELVIRAGVARGGGQAGVQDDDVAAVFIVIGEALDAGGEVADLGDDLVGFAEFGFGQSLSRSFRMAFTYFSMKAMSSSSRLRARSNSRPRRGFWCMASRRA